MHLDFCPNVLVESGANKDLGRTDTGATPLVMADFERAPHEVVRFLVESGANNW